MYIYSCPHIHGGQKRVPYPLEILGDHLPKVGARTKHGSSVSFLIAELWWVEDVGKSTKREQGGQNVK